MLNDKLISKIIQKYIGEKALRVSEIVGKGFMNRTFLIETRTTKYIIRAREENIVSEYKKERWCMEKSTNLGIPTPQVLHIDNEKSTTFMIETYIDRVNGLDSNNPKEIWFYIGDYAKKLHSLPVSGFGLELIDESNGIFIDRFSPTLKQQIDYNICRKSFLAQLFR